ncbi:hypothetical protein ABZT17_21630 [Streptomyces sp. NPDC005648]|uniref:hypothetical protein n=1 Tax=Streptomyces sp. NPDC005648 TaxID=3157044 RepID=UPI0033AD47DD
MRIDGSRVSVKFPTCPTDRAETVEVYDGDSEKLPWRAHGPKTPQGERGTVALWKADDFLEATAATQPRGLPRSLDVSVTYAGTDDGTGGVFDVRQVMTAHLGEGRYWTEGCPMTEAEIDAQFGCTQ